MATLVKVAPASEIPEGFSKRVRTGKWDVTVFHAEDGFRAVKDECPHQMVSLCGGPVRGNVVTCPGHNWTFDLTTGQCLQGDPEMRIRTFPVVVRDGVVYVEV